MKIRRYVEADIPILIDRAQEALSVTQYRDLFFSREKMDRLLRSNVKNSQFFVAVALDDAENIIGGICAQVSALVFSYDAIAIDHLFYVTPSNRQTRAATELVAAYIEWAKQRKVKRVRLSNSMGVRVEQFARLATRFGFEQMGTIHMMRL